MISAVPTARRAVSLATSFVTLYQARTTTISQVSFVVANSSTSCRLPLHIQSPQERHLNGRQDCKAEMLLVTTNTLDRSNASRASSPSSDPHAFFRATHRSRRSWPKCTTPGSDVVLASLRREEMRGSATCLPAL